MNCLHYNRSSCNKWHKLFYFFKSTILRLLVGPNPKKKQHIQRSRIFLFHKIYLSYTSFYIYVIYFVVISFIILDMIEGENLCLNPLYTYHKCVQTKEWFKRWSGNWLKWRRPPPPQNLTPNKFKLNSLMNDSKYCKPTLICMREFLRGKREPCLRE